MESTSKIQSMNDVVKNSDTYINRCMNNHKAYHIGYCSE